MKEFELRTRKVFDAHHREQANHDLIFERLVSLISVEYFGFPEGFFAGKSILDAGCGSNANASYRFAELGAAQVTALDLGADWMDCAQSRLGEYLGRVRLLSGNVMDIPLPDEMFDFVNCSGVLHHVVDPRRAFRELARVTCSSGYTFITVMSNGDGILYQCINALRGRYAEDKVFRDAVDNLTAEKLHDQLTWLLDVRDQYEEASPLERSFFDSLVDEDLVLTIKDRLQAPSYHEFGLTEEQVRSWYEQEKYTDIRRLTRYPKGFRNLRRFLSPLYFHYDHPVSRLLLGRGYIQLIGRKT